MKRTVLSLSLVIGLSSFGFAQQEELKSATANLEKKNYIAALDDISKAKKAVTKLISDNIASVLPAKFGEFEMQKDDFGGGMDMGGVSVTKTYRKPKPSSEGTSGDAAMNDPAIMDPMMGQDLEQITVQITNNMMNASEVQNAHSMQEGGMSSGDVKPIRVKGYRAITKSYGGGENEPGYRKMQQAQAIVGGAFISVDIEGVKEPGQALKFLETIDFEKLIGMVGK
ncbi:MAG: hypothetical protein GC178_02625 [Flavobacteriales bacterium]|nr:hypothetical protein [Flavobacteriales bacterium]